MGTAFALFHLTEWPLGAAAAAAHLDTFSCKMSESTKQRSETRLLSLSLLDFCCLLLLLIEGLSAIFCGILLIFAPQRDGQTDPLEAHPWTPGVLAHLVPSRVLHQGGHTHDTAQKVESLRYIMARTAIRTGRRPPLPVPAAAPSGRPRLHSPPPRHSVGLVDSRILVESR